MSDSTLRQYLAHLLDSNIWKGKQEAHFPNTVNCYPLADALLEDKGLKIERITPKWTVQKSVYSFIGKPMWEVKRDWEAVAFFTEEIAARNYLRELLREQVLYTS